MKHHVVELVDEDDNIIGTIEKEEAHRQGLLHRVAAIYLTNKQGEILVQVRDDGRIEHSASGHVEISETYLDAAKRELEEELGVTNVDLREIGACKSKNEKGVRRHYYRVYEVEANPVKLQQKEVQAVIWKDPLEVWKEMQVNDSRKLYSGGFRHTLKLYLETKHLI